MKGLDYLIKVRILNKKKAEAQVFAATQIMVGRSLDADVIFSWKGVSRQHASIRQKDGILYIRDLNSKGGVKVNGKSLEPGRDVQYLPGDPIQFGSLEKIVKLELVQAGSPSDDVRTDRTSHPMDDGSLTVKLSDIGEAANKEKSISWLSRISSIRGPRNEESAVQKAKLIVEKAQLRAERIVENAEWKAENIILRAEKKAEEIKLKIEKEYIKVKKSMAQSDKRKSEEDPQASHEASKEIKKSS